MFSFKHGASNLTFTVAKQFARSNFGPPCIHQVNKFQGTRCGIHFLSKYRVNKLYGDNCINILPSYLRVIAKLHSERRLVRSDGVDAFTRHIKLLVTLAFSYNICVLPASLACWGQFNIDCWFSSPQHVSDGRTVLFKYLRFFVHKSIHIFPYAILYSHIPFQFRSCY